MRWVVLSGLLLVAGNRLAAQETWKRVLSKPRSPDEAAVMISVDTGRVYARGDTTFAWERDEFDTPQTSPGVARPFMEAFFLVAFDCQGKRTSLRAYRHVDADGRQIDADQMDSPHWSELFPNSKGEQLSDRVCPNGKHYWRATSPP